MDIANLNPDPDPHKETDMDLEIIDSPVDVPAVGANIEIKSSKKNKEIKPALLKSKAKVPLNTNMIKKVLTNKNELGKSNILPTIQKSVSPILASTCNISQPSLPSQNMHSDTSPSLPHSLTRSLYVHTDSGPFIVQIEYLEESPSAGSTLHPLKFGALLHQYNFKAILDDGIKKIGRNRLEVRFSTFEEANNFLQSKIWLNKGFKTFIPSYNISRMGVIREVPLEWSPEEIINNIRVPEGYGNIIKARRVSRKVVGEEGPVWKPTQTIICTFDGQNLPNRVFSFFSALPVEQYVYPTIQCFLCCRFGHTRIQCRSKGKCFKCSEEHDSKSCTIETTNAKCPLCSGKHFGISKSCPEYRRQLEIKKQMATYNIPYAEANKSVPPVRPSYAEVTNNSCQPSFTPPHNHNDSPLNNKTSYKKTVLLPPPNYSHTPLDPHFIQYKEIIKDYNTDTSQKGCGYPKTDSSNTTNNLPLNPNSPNISIPDISSLISSIVEIILHTSLPYDVAIKLIQDISINIYNKIHRRNNTVEL